jgi:hypothetical protein
MTTITDSALPGDATVGAGATFLNSDSSLPRIELDDDDASFLSSSADKLDTHCAAIGELTHCQHEVFVARLVSFYPEKVTIRSTGRRSSRRPGRTSFPVAPTVTSVWTKSAGSKFVEDAVAAEA